MAGFLMEKEIEYLGERPGRTRSARSWPSSAAPRSAARSTCITNLLGKVDALIIGGGMAYTFYRAQGLPIGDSLVEEDKVDLAAEILEQAEARGREAAAAGGPRGGRRVRAPRPTPRWWPAGGIEDGWMALDIGPETCKLFAAEIAGAKTVVWNGPMGCFEMEPFAAGTLAVAEADGRGRLRQHHRRRRQRQRRQEERAWPTG